MASQTQLPEKSILLIDIGNTNLKWANASPDGIGPLQRACHVDRVVAELAGECWGGMQAPGRVLVSNVTGEALEHGLRGWMQKEWGVDPEFVHSERSALGVTNAYTVPEQLGVDRWLTLLAVHNKFPGATCIVDCGTAITVDVLSSEGEHLGGMILPGLDLMREGLLSRTRIPRVDEAPVEQLLARDTATAVASAALHSAAALVERTLSRIAPRVGSPLKLICTGNDAPKLAGEIDSPVQMEHDLVMQGLFVLAMEGRDS